MKFTFFNISLCILLSRVCFGYGALSDFVSSDGTHYRDTGNGESPVSTDLIVDPRWNSASFPLQFTLCTNLTSTNVKYQSSKTTELLSDIAVAQNSWGFGSGSVLSFQTPTTDNSCATSGAFNTSHRMIYFDTLPSGVLAYTPITITASGGNLVIIDADIVFSTSSLFRFRTHSCDTASSPSSNCSGGSLPLTFLGILTHEMGHAIGASHSMINDDNASDASFTQVTMYPSISTLSESRSSEVLSLDDRNARENLYPQTNFASSTGSVSGTVMRTASLGNRGAHISVFDLTNLRTLTGTYTSLSGTKANPSGTFTIKGIPFDTNFALFVEPVERSNDGLSTSYSNINTPIEYALSSEAEGYRAFKIEAYPDVAIPDVRLNGNALASPGFSSVHTFRLTSSSPTVTGILFNLSQTHTAPNDAALYAMTFNVDKTITNSNPLTLSLSNSFGLSVLTNSQANLTATKNDQIFDWSAALPAFTLSGSSSKVQIDRTLIDVPDGEYRVSANLSDTKYGTLVATATITASGWTSNGDIAGTSESPQSSGCSLNRRERRTPITVSIWILSFLAIARFYRKSFTSRAEILSKPKQS